jgi:perosamine synthetase
MTSPLAFRGGPRAVTHPPPHANRTAFTPADRAAILAYLESREPNSYYGRDGILAEYEDHLASFLSRRYCILTNSGTNALHSAFFAAGIEPGDEVIAPTYTFHATVTPLFQLGAVPVLADAEPDTGNLDVADVRRKLTDRTRAIVVTHQYGHPADLPTLREVASSHGLMLIEDVSLAMGAILDGVRAGSVGDIACFSLGSTKLLSGGQGGALVMDDPVLHERATLVGHFSGRSFQTVQSPLLRQFASTGLGLNYRMHPLAVAVSMSRFLRMEELVAARAERFERLSELLAATGVIDPPATRPGVSRGSWQGYCARVRPEAGIAIDPLVDALRMEGLEVSARGYHLPLHYHRLFQTREDGLRRQGPYAPNRRTYRPGDFPMAEAHVDTLIGFPLFLDEPMELVEAYGYACQKVASRLGEVCAPSGGTV